MKKLNLTLLTVAASIALAASAFAFKTVSVPDSSAKSNGVKAGVKSDAVKVKKEVKHHKHTVKKQTEKHS